MDAEKTVDEIVNDLPKWEQLIVKRLRTLIVECLPHALEKNSYGVPFYRRNRMICFIWPPSISWGSKKEQWANKGVILGFCQGNLFANDGKLLLKEGRKQVYCMYFKSHTEIDEAPIRSLLFESEIIDNEFRKNSKENRKGPKN
jgi:hypothetical protein